jgi:hypothetical protein
VAPGGRAFIVPWFAEMVADTTEAARAKWSRNIRRNFDKVARADSLLGLERT